MRVIAVRFVNNLRWCLLAVVTDHCYQQVAEGDRWCKMYIDEYCQTQSKETPEALYGPWHYNIKGDYKTFQCKP